MFTLKHLCKNALLQTAVHAALFLPKLFYFNNLVQKVLNHSFKVLKQSIHTTVILQKRNSVLGLNRAAGLNAEREESDATSNSKQQ